MRVKGLLAITIIAVMALTGSQAIAGGHDPGPMCRAANLTQAFELAWDHVRVKNNATVPRWIICPVRNDQDVETYSTEIGYISSYEVYAWFGSSAAASAEVSCTWREMGPFIGDTSASTMQTLSVTAPASLPGVQKITFNIGTANPLAFHTISCRLDPYTGINNITNAKIY